MHVVAHTRDIENICGGVCQKICGIIRVGEQDGHIAGVFSSITDCQWPIKDHTTSEYVGDIECTWIVAIMKNFSRD